MTDSNATDVRDLLSKLTDETLDPHEAEQLNTLLKLDPIAQQQYLDHMLIHGLLHREYSRSDPLEQPVGEFAAPKRAVQPEGLSTVGSAQAGPTRGHSGSRLLTGAGMKLSLAAAALLLALGVLAWFPKANTSSRMSVRMTDPGFEQGMVSDVRIQPNTWYGDDVDVVGRHSDIDPMEGSQMLRFVKSTSAPERGCEIYQIIPLDSIELKREPLLIEASAFFNAADKDQDRNDFAFEIALFALSKDPSMQSHAWPMHAGNALTFGGSQLPADTDSKSWQELKTQLSLPPGTRYLVVQLGVIHTSNEESLPEFPGQFVDDVKVNLVSMRSGDRSRTAKF